MTNLAPPLIPPPTVGRIAAPTCRQAIVEAFKALQESTGRTDFSVGEIIGGVRAAGATRALATIRTHLASVMYADRTVDRVSRGTYRLSSVR
jgi:hypothetical protein